MCLCRLHVASVPHDLKGEGPLFVPVDARSGVGAEGLARGTERERVVPHCADRASHVKVCGLIRRVYLVH